MSSELLQHNRNTDGGCVFVAVFAAPPVRNVIECHAFPRALRLHARPIVAENPIPTVASLVCACHFATVSHDLMAYD